MLILVTLSLFMTLLFFFATNPLTMGLILILQTILISLIMGFMQKSFWFLYILILIFIGGMLIMFIYMTSVFPNEKFVLNQKIMYMYMTIMLMSIPMFLILNKTILLNFPMQELLNMNQSTENSILNYTIKIFNSNSNLILFFLVIYLFYCMLIIIKIINIFKGPLRKMNYV
uniref:NADH-ubiquinone oxidoreductase chain 6 n=1 Tax=Waoraniella jarlinsoni TaxID=2597004 RepID=A0A8K2AU33_9NEOP|nr:NADH dehydrogenase subunit 6 [Waoraniella jarlinsoni]